jgi:serine/threonine protein phosphatase 1
VPLLLPNNILLVDTGTALGCELSAVNVLNLTYVQSGTESVEWKPVKKLNEVRMQW